MKTTSVHPDWRDTPSPSSVAGIAWTRLLVVAAVLIAAWFFGNPIQRSIINVLFDLSGGTVEPGSQVLTLHRYLLIGATRTMWWLLVALLIAGLSRYRPVELKWRGRASVKDLMLGLAVGTASISVVIALIVLTKAGQITTPSLPMTTWGPTSLAWLFAEGLIAASEELLFRATLFLLIVRLAGMWPAMAISSILFAAAHGGNATDPIFGTHLVLAGAVFAIALKRSGAIWWPIGVHTGWNWSCATLFGAVNSGVQNGGQILGFVPLGPRWLDGGVIGPEASLFAVLGNLVELLLVVWLTRSRSEQVLSREISDDT